MIKLIKADLIGILTLFADCRPQLDYSSLALDIQKLKRHKDRDFLFLARREKSYLFPATEVYTANSYAFLCWMAYSHIPGTHVDALYLHVSRAVRGRLLGSVVLLDYADTVRDVEQAATIQPQDAAINMRDTIRHYRNCARIVSTLDFITILRKEGVYNGCQRRSCRSGCQGRYSGDGECCKAGWYGAQECGSPAACPCQAGV